jgi:hypothetical protein
MFPPLALPSRPAGERQFGPGTVGIWLKDKETSKLKLAASVRIRETATGPDDTSPPAGLRFDSVGTEAWWFDGSTSPVLEQRGFPAVGTFMFEWSYRLAPEIVTRNYGRMERDGTAAPSPVQTHAEATGADGFVIKNRKNNNNTDTAWCFREFKTVGGKKVVVAEHWVVNFQHWVSGEKGRAEFVIRSETQTLQSVIARLPENESNFRYYHHPGPPIP